MLEIWKPSTEIPTLSDRTKHISIHCWRLKFNEKFNEGTARGHPHWGCGQNSDALDDCKLLWLGATVCDDNNHDRPAMTRSRNGEKKIS